MIGIIIATIGLVLIAICVPLLLICGLSNKDLYKLWHFTFGLLLIGGVMLSIGLVLSIINGLYIWITA